MFNTIVQHKLIVETSYSAALRVKHNQLYHEIISEQYTFKYEKLSKMDPIWAHLEAKNAIQNKVSEKPH